MPPLSRNEAIKGESRYLRGTIAEGLENAATGALAEDDTQLTKFHGIYQQDDRDLRPERAKKRMEKAYSFMVRLRVPGGVLAPAQWLAMTALARIRASGTLRLTTRQTIQLHGVIKSNLRPTIQGIHAALLDTIAACGDDNRNVICTPFPTSKLHAEALAAAHAISSHLRPRSHAWHEIFIDGTPLTPLEQEEEPILGRTYLPRKFKIAIAIPPLNDVDVFAHELGLIAIAEAGRLVAYNVVVGGGMGMTHGEPATFPRTGDLIGSITPEQAVALAEQVVTVQRDWGDRVDRKHARLKYTIERVGLDAFRCELERRLGFSLAPPRPFVFTRSGDPAGWLEGEDRTAHYCLFVENGRIADRPGRAFLSGLAEIAAVHEGRFILTPNQNLLIADIAPSGRAGIAALLAAHGLDRPPSALRRNAMACVALPTCGLALAESERYLPSLLTSLEEIATGAGLAGDEITIRMTGCPNGCARPYLAEIGLVGVRPGIYNLYLGGGFDGTRLSKLYRRELPHDGILAALSPLLFSYAANRSPGERFSDFVLRTGVVRPTTAGNRFHEDLSLEVAAA
ncbi:MAG: NADPH-dependent assimilatory sulfite reductase hemoprotein subunit [Acetobacteraceae bacterium]